ncbi:2-dehydropantoate 2-reductase [Ostreiculturibacter nitratireducens]|uniref:ketopantoate reductase family protein n=1 Tax=Ostreiculturibacter nitratireducens TaxID=3075226 RepID=UPI0031B611F9
MKITILGVGGIGGFLAAKLAPAGHSVSLLARGAHLDAIRSTGLRLIEDGRETVVRPEAISDRIAEFPRAELMIFAVKGQDLPGMIDAARPHMGPETLVLPFQNGVDAPDLLAAACGEGNTLIGVARIFSNITAPGEVTQYGDMSSFTLGDRSGGQSSPGVSRIIAAFRAAGIATPDCDDVTVDLWMKFLLFNAVSGATAGARCRFRDIRGNPDLLDFFHGLVAEAEAVGRARGVSLPEDAVERTMSLFARLPDEARSSTAHDLEQGKPLEVDRICGAVARMGRELGVETPNSAAVAALLAPWKNGAAGA